MLPITDCARWKAQWSTEACLNRVGKRLRAIKRLLHSLQAWSSVQLGSTAAGRSTLCRSIEQLVAPISNNFGAQLLLHCMRVVAAEASWCPGHTSFSKW